MSETAKIRLVLCPKCENLLPEVTDYSVYQCGGCGAVLRAKNKGADSKAIAVSDKSDEVVNVQKPTDNRYDKMVTISEGRAMEMSDGSESDVRSSISSSSRAERKILHDEDQSYKRGSKEESTAAVIVDDDDGGAKIGQEFEDLATSYEANEEGRIGEKGEMEEGFWRGRRMENDVMGRGKEGPSNAVLSRSSYGNENRDSRNGATEFNTIDYVERDDQAELLKKLEELKDQLSRSGNLIDKGKEKVPFDRRTLPKVRQDPYWHSDASLEADRVLMDAPFGRPAYHNQYTDPSSMMMHRQEIGGRGFYPTGHGQGHHVPGYGDPSRAQMHRRGPYGASAPYQMYMSHPYRSGPYADDGMVYMDPMEPYPPNFSRHHQSCLCYQCRQRRQLPMPVIPPAYSDIPNDRIFGYHDNPGSYGSHNNNNNVNHRLPDAHPARHRHVQPSLSRWPSDIDSEVDGFVHRRPARVHLVSGGKCCRPMAGGAPFLTCYNCFELLLLPKRVLAKDDDRKKMRCGACSTLIVFTISDRNLVVSYDVDAKDDTIEVGDALPMNGGKHPNQLRTVFSSEDYDNYGYDFNSMSRESDQALSGQGRANRSIESNNRHSTSTYTSDAEEDWDNSLTATRKDSGSADLPKKNKGPSLPLGTSLQDHFEYSNKHCVAANCSVEGNRSGRSEHEKVMPSRTTSRQISGKESSATEIDLSSNEFGNAGTNFDSGEAIREGDQQLKISKVAESFFAGIIKKSFKDKSSDASDQEKANVTVNGHPIPNRVIKKAEKVSGAIHPGNYWYDFRAGFWGVMGGPCLGIIPPCIEEFNYPMPKNCAGGNTCVFVNGRELNQKDLALLGSRGLPTERDRSYIIEISGKVVDEDTGQELDSLGKLAPTVERVKRGFGMKAPKAAA